MLTKKRFKLITNPDWWRIYCFYFQDEFEKIKNGLRLFENEELSFFTLKDKDGNEVDAEDGFSFKEYLRQNNPQAYFEKNHYNDFYSKKLKFEYKAQNAEEDEDLEDNNIQDSDESSGDSDDSDDSKSKKKRTDNKEKLKLEVKEENEHKSNYYNENNDNIKMDFDLEGEEVIYERNTKNISRSRNEFGKRKTNNINVNNNNNNEIKEESEAEKSLSKSLLVANKTKINKNNLFEATEKHYLENLSTTFLPELSRLQYKEDNRLLTSDGEADLAAERLKFHQMRNMVFKDFEDLRRLCAQEIPFIECYQCHNFICNVSSLKPCEEKFLHRITGWIDPFIAEVELDKVNFHNQFMNDILLDSDKLRNKEAKVAKFISCRDASRVFGFKNYKGECFIADNSPVRIVFPCGKIKPFSYFYAQNNYEEIHKENVDSVKERDRLIRLKARCLICNVNFDYLKSAKEIEAKRREHFEKDKFHKEMVKEFVEEDFD